MYLIANCPSCGKIILAKTSNRTRTCPHCGYKASLFSLRILARAETSGDANAIIQALKEKQADESWKPVYKRFKPRGV